MANERRFVVSDKSKGIGLKPEFLIRFLFNNLTNPIGCLI